MAASHFSKNTANQLAQQNVYGVIDGVKAHIWVEQVMHEHSWLIGCCLNFFSDLAKAYASFVQNFARLFDWLKYVLTVLKLYVFSTTVAVIPLHLIGY